MEQFKYGQKPGSQVFDLEKMAKFYAIVDISQAYHSLVWHNMRFYYNPVTSLLEPIGFDGYSELGVMRYSSRPLIGAIVNDESDPFVHSLHVNLFKEQDFVADYLQYLELFSSNEYLQQFVAFILPAFERRYKAIQQEFPHYKYDLQDLKERSRLIRQYIFPLAHAGVQVYRQTRTDDSMNFVVNNHHILPLLVLGWGTDKGENINDSLAKPRLMEPYDKGRIARQYKISGPPNARYLYYKLPGLDSLYRTAIIPVPPQLDESPMQKLLKEVRVESGKGYEIRGNQIIFQIPIAAKKIS